MQKKNFRCSHRGRILGVEMHRATHPIITIDSAFCLRGKKKMDIGRVRTSLTNICLKIMIHERERTHRNRENREKMLGL